MNDVADLARALSVVSRGLERARRVNPAAGTLALLHQLHQDRPVRPTDLAADTGVHPSQVTRQLRSLEEAGLVQVTPAATDARSVDVTLTDPGIAERDRLQRIGVERFGLFVADWSAAEVTTLTRLLDRFEESKLRAGRQ